MSTIEEKIATLKQSVATATDLEEPWKYFFDHLVDDPRFVSMGKPTKVSKVEEIIKAVGAQFFRQEGRFQHMMAFVLRRFGFTHGSCLLDGQMTAYFFFDELNMGVAGILHRERGSCIIRFTVFRNVVAGSGLEKAEFIPSPALKRTVH